MIRITLSELFGIESGPLDERLTFDQLFRLSDQGRIGRSHSVRGPPLEIDASQDSAYHYFNFKSFPSTTHLRHKGYVRFFKPKSGRQVPMERLECEVDCQCPDFKYRWAWANKQRGSSRVGPSSLNQAWNKAPRITNPGSRPGLCKHILACRNYIYGLLSKFPKEKGYTDFSTKLDKLTRVSTKRWINYDAEMQKAKEREGLYKTANRRRNVQGPQPMAGQPAPRPNRIQNEVPSPLPPEQPVKQKRPVQPPQPPPVNPVKNPASKPILPKKKTPPIDPRRRQNENPEESLVVTTEKTNMKNKSLIEAQKIVEELESEMASSDTALASSGGMGGPPTDAGDGAGGDNEALELLRGINAGIQSLVTAIAPPAEEGAEGVEGEIGDEGAGDELGGEAGGLPPGGPGGEEGAEGMDAGVEPPPTDDDELEELSHEGEEEEDADAKEKEEKRSSRSRRHAPSATGA